MAEDTKPTVYSQTVDVEETPNEDTSLALKKLEEENRILHYTVTRIKEESNMLKGMFDKANSELENLKKPSLLVADVVALLNGKAVIKLPNANKFYCNISKEIKGLKADDCVLVEQKTLNVVKKIDLGQNLDVEKFVIIEKPKLSWKDIGGLKEEINEIKEVIELPLNKPELFETVGIKPPKGVLLHGPPGTGKTLLAKAVANSTKATFIEVVGSELVQKFIGEGAKLVKEIFNLARNKSPAIVFIDEIDALAAMRMETGTSGEREVNRTFMQLLAELDGFKHLGEVKVIGATNRIDILDNAMTRPGRLDRLIEVGLPDQDGRLEILKVHSKNMNLKNVKLKELVKEMDNFSGAEIQAVCTEAGYFAIREIRSHITHKDFLMAIDKVRREEDEDKDHEGLYG
jgi:proteasome regulatory subunit